MLPDIYNAIVVRWPRVAGAWLSTCGAAVGESSLMLLQRLRDYAGLRNEAMHSPDANRDSSVLESVYRFYLLAGID